MLRLGLAPFFRDSALIVPVSFMRGLHLINHDQQDVQA